MEVVIMNMDIAEFLSVKDKALQHDGTLHGHVTIHRRNKETGETKFWYEGDNVISISGMQTIMMKIFNLYLDSYHSSGQSDQSYTDNRGRDTNLVIPDMNESRSIGVKPNEYTSMDEDISSNYFIQGFMVGHGGAGEDTITTKNTNYSYVNLREPIPFQQTSTSLTNVDAGKYCGVYQPNGSTVKSYYIKKFDELPHIYHSWWVDGQRWDYVDPVTPNDLGPYAQNGEPKTNRIETYCQCKLSIDTSDCKDYFEGAGNTSTAQINELGLVAFDSTGGTYDTMTMLYRKTVTELLNMTFDNNRPANADEILKGYASLIMETIEACYEDSFGIPDVTNLANFHDTMNLYFASDGIDYETIRQDLSDDENIGVLAYYDQNGNYQYETDKFMTYLKQSESLTNGEAQRIKLITYYTFNSIPLEENWEILIDYRLYAN
jgi:hypothetical protein